MEEAFGGMKVVQIESLYYQLVCISSLWLHISQGSPQM